MQTSKFITVSLCIAFAMLGCNSVDLESVVPAKGVLTYQGKPLANYKLTFEPKEAGRHAASAVTDAEGKFSLGTNVPDDGAAAGVHRVSVVFVAEKIEGEPGREIITAVKPSVKIPEKYGSRETSGLEVEIPASGSQSLEIKLE